jgi:hypothetical protein
MTMARKKRRKFSMTFRPLPQLHDIDRWMNHNYDGKDIMIPEGYANAFMGCHVNGVPTAILDEEVVMQNLLRSGASHRGSKLRSLSQRRP